jgi:hypothetical protein
MFSQFRPCSLFLTLVLLAGMASGQHSGIGIKGGFVNSSMQSEVTGFGPIPGATLGLYMPLHTGPRMELQPEMLFTTLGARYNLPDGDGFTDRILYLQFPLVMKLYLGNAVNVQPAIQPSYKLKAWRTGAESTDDISGYYNNIDFALIPGLGIDLRSGWDMTIRYQHGVSASLANDQTVFPRHRALSFTLGYRVVQYKLRAPVRKRR